MKQTSAYLKSLGITRPCVVIDEGRGRANIRAMAAKASRSEVAFRPHFKTHQSSRIGRWFADAGVDRITVSSLPMAEHFAEAGWKDITIAFLVNPLELPRMADLARYIGSRGGRLGLTVDSVAAARAVAGLDVDVWIKVDTGYGRTGVRWDAPDRLAEILAAADGPIGLLTHAGHSYSARSREESKEVHAVTVTRLTAANRGLKLSIGDTPCCSAVDRFRGVDEIRPGNFVFYDLMQLQIGSCKGAQLAAAAVCPVVGIYPERQEIVLHGGAVHLSKESLVLDDGRRIYGKLGTLDFAGEKQQPGLGRVLDDAPVISLSQEHGVVAATKDIIGRLQIGDLVIVWPVHSCLMCDLMREPVILPRGD